MSDPVNDYALDLFWRDGRSYNGWLDKDVPETLIRAVYDLAKMGATSANCCPARFVFIRTPDVDAIAVLVDDLVVRPGGVLRHREWGLYEVGICGPDGMLVRIGWPSRLMQGPAAAGSNPG